MSIEHGDFLAEQDAIDNALDSDCDPFAGEDPDDDYLEAEAERRMAFHEEQVHAGGPCDCPPAPVKYGEAPF